MRERSALEGLLSVSAKIVTLFAIAAIGYAAKRTGFMTADFDKSLSKLVLTISLPALIVGSVLNASTLPSPDMILLTFAIACICVLVVIPLAYVANIIMRAPKGFRGVFKFMMCFGNTGFIGYPVLTAVFGLDSLIYATVFLLPFNFVLFTIGVWFITQDNEEDVKIALTWRTFLSPANIASALAIVFALCGLNSVPLLGDTLDTLGSLTVPAALLIVGSSLANMHPRELLGSPRLWIVSAVRLLVAPIAIWALLRLFVSDPLMLGVMVVISGMPVATNGTMLCYQYGGNVKAMTQGTFITTTLSLISIPLIAQLVAIA